MSLPQPSLACNRPISAVPLGDFGDFSEVCEQQRVYIQMGILDRMVAIDNMQRLAELWMLAESDQDLVQEIMAALLSNQAIKANPQKSNRAIAEEIGADEKTVRKARADQSAPEAERTGRDGKAYPAEGRPRPYRTPQSTVDAFFYLTSNEPGRLRIWLEDHPRDVAYLHKLWKEKTHAVAA